ncbi:MAG TPA: hypothetical protein VGP44_06910 [Gemmatimonadales bacterium]|nr:hypothetical protein [Gemmatimonadales bacterium]
MSDIGDRADDYERRLSEAEASDVLSDAFREGRGNAQLPRWLGVGVAVAVLLLITVGFLAFTARQTANRADENADRITELFREQANEKYARCLVDAEIITKRNAGNLELIEVENKSLYDTALERDLSRKRIAALTNALIIPVPVCSR